MSTAADFFVNLEDKTSFNLFCPHVGEGYLFVYSEPYGEGECQETMLQPKNEILVYAYAKREHMPNWAFKALEQYAFNVD